MLVGDGDCAGQRGMKGRKKVRTTVIAYSIKYTLKIKKNRHDATHIPKGHERVH